MVFVVLMIFLCEVFGWLNRILLEIDLENRGVFCCMMVRVLCNVIGFILWILVLFSEIVFVVGLYNCSKSWKIVFLFVLDGLIRVMVLFGVIFSVILCRIFLLGWVG